MKGGGARRSGIILGGGKCALIGELNVMSFGAGKVQIHQYGTRWGVSPRGKDREKRCL